MDYRVRWPLGPSLIPTIIFSLLTLLGVNELVGPTPFTEIPWPVKAFSTFGLAIVAWVAWAQTSARIGKNALVAAVDSEALWVRVRSPLNKHIGSTEDDLLVALPLEQMRWSCLTTIATMRVVNRKPRTDHETYLDLGFEGLDVDTLKQILEEERAFRKAASTVHQHFPIKILEGETVRVSLLNVGKGARGLQAALPASVEKREPQSETIDLR